MFPLAWVDEGADIDSDPDLVKEAKAFLVTPFVAVDAVMGVCIIHNNIANTNIHVTLS